MSENFGQFVFLTGDVNFPDYGGTWSRKLRNRRAYHVIELINWIDAVGEREAKEIGQKYHVRLSEIDLDLIDPTDALRSCGFELSDGKIINKHDGSIVCEENIDLAIVDCCHGYGARAPISDESGNNYRKLIRAASKLSRELERDPEAHEQAMDRPVNAIGTSARRYMQGKILARD